MPKQTIFKVFKVAFFSSRETTAFLAEDRDHYVHKMSVYDLRARQFHSHASYIAHIATLAMDFTDKEKDQLLESVQKVDSKFIRMSNMFPGLDGHVIANMPWVFAKMNNVYEMGFPHTRANVIFITPKMFQIDSPRFLETLAHEKIHVYQRQYPNITNDYFVSINCKKSKHVSTFPRKRSNPDLDEWIYNCNGENWLFEYKSDFPKNIMDVDATDSSLEHPLEYMAYTISKYMFGHSTY